MARVMVVDDDDDVRAAVRKALERAGHDVTEEPDGGRALRHFTGNPVDLVICDVYMPDMDGIDFLIRVREVFPEARTILMSGGGQLGKESVLAAASRLGADRVLEKPFEMAALLGAVDEILGEDDDGASEA